MPHGEAEPTQYATRRVVSPGSHPVGPGEFLQLFVKYGGPALVLLWDCEPEQHAELLDKWCEWATTKAWAREETRALLYKLVLRGETPPRQLCEVLRFPELRLICGPREKRSSDYRLAYIVKALEDEGYTKPKVNRIFETSRSDGGNTFDRTTLGKRLERINNAPEGKCVAQGTVEWRINHPCDGAMNPRRFRANGCSPDPLSIIQELLSTHQGRALELLWDDEPDKHPTFVRTWSERAKYQGAMWDAVRRFVDDKICRGQQPPKDLVWVASRSRPRSKRDPRCFERDILWHAIVVTVKRMGHKDAKARLLDEVCKSGVISDSTYNSALQRGREYVYDYPRRSIERQSGRQERSLARMARPTMVLPPDRTELPVGLMFPLKDCSERIVGAPALQSIKDLGPDAKRYANRSWIVCGVSTLRGIEDIGPDKRLWIRWGGLKYVDGENTWLEFATTCESDSDGAAPKPFARSRSLDSRMAWKWYAIVGIEAIVNLVFLVYPKPNGGEVRWRHFFAYIEDPYYLANLICRDGIETVSSGQAGPRMGPCAETHGLS